VVHFAQRGYKSSVYEVTTLTCLFFSQLKLLILIIFADWL